ncbi:MAG: WecB/TagA/CpsF family glycosyltransferase [Roseiflexus sp.]|nr:WecB/TagA/CpsF family glycosyltransferase [Roseiflexus sp.]MCS7289210.1 WecB/TagA/CpsF family glycosyltransferase [Roseiflexus sp.]MDW8144746.1 WecB/TagA/CpsF family glycosyltransferase [Roseiflexaceae bacterium]MDW8232211.1 WecB/TagA/CpsF family glycosyltransferase [Roseiflexaceae bacterium]
MRKRVTILGVAVDDVLMDDAIAAVARFIADGGPHQIVTINPEFIMEARRNCAFRQVLAAADLATPDGFGIILAARWRGTPLRGRVTGVALTERIAAEAAQRGWSLFLLGAAPGVAERAAAALQRANPGLRIAGCYAGSPHPDDEPAIRERILAAKPDVLLVAYGHPAQDLWIARNQPILRVPVAMGVGGTFDELAGVVPRAPALVQRLGLKWLYRLLVQPWRWRRIMTAVPLFLWTALRERRSFNESHAQE